MPEGDSLRRYAERVSKLEGEVLAVETPHPRAQLLGLSNELDGKRLERVEAIGKNLLLTFEGGLVLRSHLKTKGRWQVRPVFYEYTGRPWLVLRGREWQALQWNGPILELTRRRPPVAVRRLGPDIMDDPPDLDGMVGNLRRAAAREIGDAILDRRLVAGIGNMWKAEGLVPPLPGTGAASRRWPGGGPDAGPGRNRARRLVTPRVASPAPRAPHLLRALRAFCLGAFFDLGLELEAGADLPVSLEEHAAPGRPTLYEYRPLVGSFVESRAERLGRRDDAQAALAALKDEPAAGIFAQAHAGERVGEDEALRRTILVPLVVATAEACGGFDWDDAAFERGYAEFERSLFGERRMYGAVVPLVGLSAGGTIELGRGLTVRQVAGGELAATWPDANRLVPRDFGREVDRMLVMELEAELDAAACRVPEAPLEISRAITALRLATPGAIAAGPVIFERLDWRPYGVRPVPALAAQTPPGEATRLDPFRARLAVQLQERLVATPSDADVLEALDRWELALFHEGPVRADELREALSVLLGCDEGPWAAAMRAAVLLGENARERSELLTALRALVDGDGPGARAEECVRRSLVETILHDSRPALVAALDEALLGVRPRPSGTAARVVATG